MQFSKLSILAAAVAAPMALAQFSELPSCALTIAVAALGLTGCSSGDLACICAATTYMATLHEQLPVACSSEDVARTTEVSTKICASYGVVIGHTTNNVTSSAASTSSASAGVASPTSTTSETTVTASSTPSSYTGGAASLSVPFISFLGVAAILAAI